MCSSYRDMRLTHSCSYRVNDVVASIPRPAQPRCMVNSLETKRRQHRQAAAQEHEIVPHAVQLLLHKEEVNAQQAGTVK